MSGLPVFIRALLISVFSVFASGLAIRKHVEGTYSRRRGIT
jgi:hypothetical protein